MESVLNKITSSIELQKKNLDSFTSKYDETKKTIRETFNQLKKRLEEHEKKLFDKIDAIENQNQKIFRAHHDEIMSIEKRIKDTVTEWNQMKLAKNPTKEFRHFYKIDNRLKELNGLLSKSNSTTLTVYSMRGLEQFKETCLKNIDSITIQTQPGIYKIHFP